MMKNKFITFLMGTLFALISCTQLLATETRVNTTTFANQQYPAISMNASGNFVVAWIDETGDASDREIQAQRFNSSGQPLGSEFRVNTTTSQIQEHPDVAIDPNGNFVVVWRGVSPEDGSFHIYGQRYDSSGNQLGSEFQINDISEAPNYYPVVAMDRNGNFTVVWGQLTMDGRGTPINARRYDNFGSPLGSPFRVDTQVKSNQSRPAIAMNESGSFIIVWTNPFQDGDVDGVYAQKFDNSGNFQEDTFLVNTTTPGYQNDPSVAMDSSGNFLIAWTDLPSLSSNSNIYAQRFNSSGSSVGSEFRVNTHTDNGQWSPEVGMGPSGNFIITWQSALQDGIDYGIFAQKYNRDGTSQGSEFQVNTETYGPQARPDVAVAANGSYRITWESHAQDGSMYGIYMENGQLENTNSSAPGNTDNCQPSETIGFNAQYYLDNNPDVAAAGYTVDNVKYHWDNAGVYEGRQGSKYFNVQFYLENYSDIRNAFGNDYAAAYNHFINGGVHEGRQGSAEFDVSFYLSNYTDLQDAYSTDHYAAFLHWIRSGVCEGREALPEDGRTHAVIWNEDSQGNSGSDNNDSGDTNGNDSQDNQNPVSQCQASETIGFNAQYYLDNNPDVAAAGFTVDNVQYHWDNAGIYEGRQGSKYFNVQFYLENYSDIRNAFGSDYYSAYMHFLNAGVYEGRQGSTDFDVSFYLSNHTDLQDAYGTDHYSAFLHWIRSGVCEGREALPEDGQTHAVIWNNDSQDNSESDNDGGDDSNGGDTDNGDGSGGSDGGNVTGDTTTNGLSVISEKKIENSPETPQYDPDVAMDSSGNFVLTWKKEYASKLLDPGHEIVAQRYNSSGTPIGNIFQVNTYTYEIQETPCIAMNPSGDFVIAWVSWFQNFNGIGIFAQRFDKNGTPQGDEFQVHTLTDQSHGDVSISMDEQGNFIIVWRANGVYARKFNSSGSPLGDEFQVNSDTTGYIPKVAVDGNGNFSVVWYTWTQNGMTYEYEAYARLYNANCSARTEPFRVNTTTSIYPMQPSIGMDTDGNFVIAWTADIRYLPNGKYNSYTADLDIYARRFNSSGTAQGDVFKVNTNSDSLTFTPQVAMDPAGNFFITWYTMQDGTGIYAQGFNSNGVAQGSETRIDESIPTIGYIPRTTMNANGNFVVTWRDYNSTDISDLYLAMGSFEVSASANGDSGSTNTSCQTNDDIAFNPQYYLDNNPDIKAAGYTVDNVEHHWLNAGIYEGRQGSKYFDVHFYLNNYSDIRNVFGTDYAAAYNHFVNGGVFEGRQGSEYFDVTFYVNNYEDIQNAFGTNYRDAFLHWLQSGVCEGRQGLPEDGRTHAVIWNE